MIRIICCCDAIVLTLHVGFIYPFVVIASDPTESVPIKEQHRQLPQDE
jgi:hypothetical protein